MRAIAKVLESTVENSTFRIKCYRLTDCFAIDLLLHHGADRDIQVIVDYASVEDIGDDTKKNTVRALVKFLERHKHFWELLYLSTDRNLSGAHVASRK